MGGQNQSREGDDEVDNKQQYLMWDGKFECLLLFGQLHEWAR